MSGLARLLAESGHSVSGSDEKDSPAVQNLLKEGIPVDIGHKAENLPAAAELLVYSPAVDDGNSERIEAGKRGLRQLSYPQAIGMVTENFETISICGTHGKTTVTGMGAAALVKAKADPTVIVGATTKELGGRNERLGGGPYFLIESCEYRRGFLNYNPKVIIITNIELDHLDYYKNLEDYVKAFREYIEKLPPNGLLIANSDDKNVQTIIKDFTNCPVITFGTSKTADYRLAESSVMHEGEVLAEFKLLIPGIHNQMNATAVIALCYELGIDMVSAIDALNSFSGAGRRCEEKGKIGNTIILDDYGHHPTEITATLKAVREKYGSDKKILCIFQPHQYSRTLKLLPAFARAFSDADQVIIPNILRARDSDAEVKAITPQGLVQEIAKFNKNVSYENGLENTAVAAKKLAPQFDVIITMGAGDVYKIADALLS